MRAKDGTVASDGVAVTLTVARSGACECRDWTSKQIVGDAIRKRQMLPLNMLLEVMGESLLIQYRVVCVSTPFYEQCIMLRHLTRQTSMLQVGDEW